MYVVLPVSFQPRQSHLVPIDSERSFQAYLDSSRTFSNFVVAYKYSCERYRTKSFVENNSEVTCEARKTQDSCFKRNSQVHSLIVE